MKCNSVVALGQATLPFPTLLSKVQMKKGMMVVVGQKDKRTKWQKKEKFTKTQIEKGQKNKR